MVPVVSPTFHKNTSMPHKNTVFSWVKNKKSFFSCPLFSSPPPSPSSFLYANKILGKSRQYLLSCLRFLFIILCKKISQGKWSDIHCMHNILFFWVAVAMVVVVVAEVVAVLKAKR